MKRQKGVALQQGEVGVDSDSLYVTSLSSWQYCFVKVHTDQLVGKSAGLMIERLRIRIPAGAAEEFFFPELTFFC